MVEGDRKIVGEGSFGEDEWSEQPGKYFVDMSVLPEYQGKGIGKRLYQYLSAELVAWQPTKLVTQAREDKTRARRFLEDRGFRVAMRYPISELESGSFDASRFAHRVHRAEQSGIRIVPLVELMKEDPQWKQKIYDLDVKILKDVPSPDPITPPPLAEYEANVINSPEFMPEAWFLALDGQTYVGVSTLWRNLAEKARLGTGLTGVLPAYRRRGIATALKVRAVKFAQAYGNATIETGNEEHNPMLALNLELGFKPTPAWLDYVKRLDEGSD
jgi:GNAT superfamily N-acetyltransferase